MKKGVVLFLVCLGVFHGVGVAEEPGDAMAQKYMQAAEDLKARMAPYQGEAGAERFREDQLKKMNEGKAKMEAYRAAGMISAEDYNEAQAGMKQAEVFLNSGQGSELSAQLGALQQAGNAINAKCARHQADAEAYQTCIRSAIGL